MIATKTFTLPATTSHLSRLESGLIVPATKGTRTFVNTRKMFTGYFDPGFESYGTNVPSDPTPQVGSDLYEMTSNGSFKTVLESFELDPNLLFWRSQDQTLTWVKNHPNHLPPDGWSTFLPFIVGDKKFVAIVCRDDRELEAYVSHFDVGSVWDAKVRERWVLPQLTP
jgi:hypothetical protein